MKLYPDFPIEQCLCGCIKSQTILFKNLEKYLIFTAKRYLKDDDVQDVVQNSLVKIFKNLDTYNPDLGDFRGWACTICKNESLQFLRKRVIKFEDVDTVSASKMITDELNFRFLLSDTYQVAERLLPKSQKQIFYLKAMKGYTYQQIAQKIGVNEGTTKSQYSKARKKMQMALKQYKQGS